MRDAWVIFLAFDVRSVTVLVVRFAAEDLLSCFEMSVFWVITNIFGFIIYTVVSCPEMIHKPWVALSSIEPVDPFIAELSTTSHPTKNMVKGAVLHHENDDMLDGVSRLLFELLKIIQNLLCFNRLDNEK